MLGWFALDDYRVHPLAGYETAFVDFVQGLGTLIDDAKPQIYPQPAMIEYPKFDEFCVLPL